MRIAEYLVGLMRRRRAVSPKGDWSRNRVEYGACCGSQHHVQQVEFQYLSIANIARAQSGIDLIQIDSSI